MKSISNGLDITCHVFASQLSSHCDVIVDRWWCHQQNVMRASETRGLCVKILVLASFMSCKKWNVCTLVTVFKIRSETCRTEAQFCQNLYIFIYDKEGKLAGPTQILPVNVRGPALYFKTVVTNCLCTHSSVILVFISLVAAQLGK